MTSPALARSESVATGTSYETDIGKEKGTSRHIDVPNRIDEADEDDNVGYKTYKEGLETHAEITPEMNRKIRWRLDLIIMPIFLITQTLQFLDKTALNYANLFGFQTALHLKGNQFNWLSSMVYFGYAIAQYPAQLLIGKIPAQRVMAGTIFMWGFTVLTMVWCKDFKTAMVNRFFLGVFEAAVSPNQSLMTGWWYTRQEIPLRQFIWYAGLGLGGVIGSYMSTGISTLPDNLSGGVQKWQIIFYILGGITMLWAFVVFLLLPDSPASARWLSPEMRILAVQRVADNQVGIKNKKFKKYQVYSAFTDPKIIILFCSVFAAAIPNGVVSSFSTIIIKDMGFSTTKTTVLKSVGDIVQIVALVIGGIITLNVPNSRLLTATGANIICVVSAACMAYLPRQYVWGRLVSFWLVNCQSVGFSVGLVMVSSNMGGYTHKTVASAIFFTAYCFGNVAGPFVVKQSEAPYYRSATAGLLAGYAIKLGCQIILYLYMLFFNKRRDRENGPANVAEAREAGMQDKTEWENKNFRYVL